MKNPQTSMIPLAQSLGVSETSQVERAGITYVEKTLTGSQKASNLVENRVIADYLSGKFTALTASETSLTDAETPMLRAPSMNNVVLTSRNGRRNSSK